MTNEELVRALSKGIADIDQQQEAADRIEQLVATNEALTEQLKTVLDREAATIARYDAKVEKLETLMQLGFAEYERRLGKAVEGLRKLHHSVCGETGFAACVRLDSGLAYPWPALDEADELTRATLAEIEGDKG